MCTPRGYPTQSGHATPCRGRWDTMLFRLLFIFAIVYAVLRLMEKLGRQARPMDPPYDRTPPRYDFSDGGGWRPPPRSRVAPAEPSPFEVLGVSPSASDDEIHTAYQKLVREYHPDRVSGMGADLVELAERRTKEINAAYEVLKRRSRARAHG